MVAVEALAQLVPLYPLYPLLFAEHGLSDAAISALFVLWSLTSMLLEVPSGAWADATSRRRMLALSGALAAATFAGWVLVPTTAVFAVGFVLWGVATALASGTLEALVHDALAEAGAVAAYPTLMSRARAGSLTTTLIATAAAAPLVAWGGYVATGLVGSAACLASAGLALTLPEPPRVPEPADEDTGEEQDDPDLGAVSAWWAMLRSGLREVRRGPVVARAVLVAALVTGLVAVDEYVPLLAAGDGATPATVALLLTGVGVVEVAGAAVAGRLAAARERTLAVVVTGAASALAAGSLLPVLPGFAVVAVGFGALQAMLVVVDTRVQDAVTGPARATVTSVAGFGSEAVAIALMAAIGLGSLAVALPVLIALAMTPMLGVAVLLISGDRP